LSKNFQQQSRSAINYLSNGINMAEDDAVPVKFWPKAPTPIGKIRISRFTSRGALCSQRQQTLLFHCCVWSHRCCYVQRVSYLTLSFVMCGLQICYSRRWFSRFHS